MPLVQAFPLGLPLHGTTTVTFADGQNQVKLLAGAKVSVGTKTKEEFGLIILEETSTDILVGMDFLLTFKLALSRVSWRSDYLMKMRSRRWCSEIGGREGHQSFPFHRAADALRAIAFLVHRQPSGLDDSATAAGFFLVPRASARDHRPHHWQCRSSTWQVELDRADHFVDSRHYAIMPRARSRCQWGYALP